MDYNEDTGLYSGAPMLSTANTMNWKYGYVEMRAKMPFCGKGEWPAFWMLASSANISKDIIDAAVCDYNAEIDIFENMSNVNKFQSQLHLWGKDGSVESITNVITQDGRQFYTFKNSQTANDWHIYGLKWTENRLVFYVDRVAFLSYYIPRSYRDACSQYMNLIISLNSYTVNSNEATLSTGNQDVPKMYVDYVRLYQNPQTNKILTK